MVERIAPRLCGRDEHPQIFARRLLPDEFVEPLRPERGVDILRLAHSGEKAIGIGH